MQAALAQLTPRIHTAIFRVARIFTGDGIQPGGNSHFSFSYELKREFSFSGQPTVAMMNLAANTLCWLADVHK